MKIEDVATCFHIQTAHLVPKHTRRKESTYRNWAEAERWEGTLFSRREHLNGNEWKCVSIFDFESSRPPPSRQHQLALNIHRVAIETIRTITMWEYRGKIHTRTVYFIQIRGEKSLFVWKCGSHFCRASVYCLALSILTNSLTTRTRRANKTALRQNKKSYIWYISNAKSVWVCLFDDKQWHIVAIIHKKNTHSPASMRTTVSRQREMKTTYVLDARIEFWIGITQRCLVLQFPISKPGISRMALHAHCHFSLFRAR